MPAPAPPEPALEEKATALLDGTNEPLYVNCAASPAEMYKWLDRMGVQDRSSD